MESELKQLMDIASGAGGVGLIAYGLFSRVVKKWEEMQALISKALNDVSEIKQDRSKCRPAHDHALEELYTLTRAMGERIAKLEAVNESKPIIKPEQTKWIN